LGNPLQIRRLTFNLPEIRGEFHGLKLSDFIPLRQAPSNIQNPVILSKPRTGNVQQAIRQRLAHLRGTERHRQ
jgi:hypothetical protein